MNYRFKANDIILDASQIKITPKALPASPQDGYVMVDTTSKKFKVWFSTGSRWITLGDAVDQVFSNASNGFVSTNVQAAIEESKNSAPGKARATIVTTFNGVVTNNNWLGYNELIPGNEVPIRIPWNCQIKEITFAYKNTGLVGDRVDGRFDLYKNGLLAGNIIYNTTFTNQLGGKNVSGLSLAITANDTIVGRWIDQGDNPSDMAIAYFFQLT